LNLELQTLNALKIVFMGTPDFAVASLAALVDAGCHVVGVITAPDREAGRGMKPRPSAVKEYALSKGLHIMQPTNLKSELFLEELRDLKADLQIVVAFRMLPEVVWNMPPKGTFNLHASLLPQYRGAAPINWAVINGEKETGVTTFFLQQQIDTGNIILQEKLSIGDNETAGELHDRLMALGAQLVVRTVELISSGEVKAIPQASIEAGALREAPKIFKDTCRIDWNLPTKKVFDHIRGLSPYPAAQAVLYKDGAELPIKVFSTRMEMDIHDDAKPGHIASDHRTYLHVRCADGWLSLLELQLAGKRRMPILEFLKGFDPTGMHA
jgi:methionyl-tRNA formyltransferase